VIRVTRRVAGATGVGEISGVAVEAGVAVGSGLAGGAWVGSAWVGVALEAAGADWVTAGVSLAVAGPGTAVRPEVSVTAGDDWEVGLTAALATATAVGVAPEVAAGLCAPVQPATQAAQTAREIRAITERILSSSSVSHHTSLHFDRQEAGKSKLAQMFGEAPGVC
jgi:hypothetical protein